MDKRRIAAVFFGFMLLSLSVMSVVPTATSSLQVSDYRLSAKGGIPGPPDKPSPEGPTPPTIESELFIEIDYLEGHRPTDLVLTYVHDYYYARGISVTFYLDDEYEYSDVVADPTPETGVTDDDFWAIQTAYDDHDGGYDSKWKWVLFGTTVEGKPDTMGYAYVMLGIRYNPASGRVRSVDCLAGNYLFVADGAADSWAISAEIDPYGAEAAVLMHEMGHSIGIERVGWSGNVFELTVWEIYDSDTGSVMSYLSEANAGLYGAWYYSNRYWKLRNLEYYAIAA